MEKATRMASVRTSQGVSAISGVPGDWSAKRAMGCGVGIRTSAVAGGQPKRGVDDQFDPRPGCRFASEFGYQFREPVDDPDVQPLEARPVLVAVGGQHAVDAHGGGRLGVVGRVAEIDHIFRPHV